ncbi:diphthine synthase [Cladochytrium tenue]|nr:diphthine synthase [Cladochytrium tenue]
MLSASAAAGADAANSAADALLPGRELYPPAVPLRSYGRRAPARSSPLAQHASSNASTPQRALPSPPSPPPPPPQPPQAPASRRRSTLTVDAEPAVARPGTPPRIILGTRQPSSGQPPTVVAFGRTMRAAAPRASGRRPEPAATRGAGPRAGSQIAPAAPAAPPVPRPLTDFPPRTLAAATAHKLESVADTAELETDAENELPACVVCLCPEPQLRTTCCRQPYHVSCAYKWLLVNKSCPTCRFAMPLRGEYPAVPRPPPRPRPLPPPPRPSVVVADVATDTDGLQEAPVPPTLEVPRTPPAGIRGRGEFVDLALEAARIPYVDVAREYGPAAIMTAMVKAPSTARSPRPYAAPFIEAIPATDPPHYVSHTTLALHHLAVQLPGRLCPEGYADQALQVQLTATDLIKEKFLAYFEDLAPEAGAGSFIVEGLKYMFPTASKTLLQATPRLVRLAEAVRGHPGVAAYLSSPRRLTNNKDAAFAYYPDLYPSTMVLYVIGLGLGDERDITVRGLEAVRACERVYLEAYTSILTVGKDRLEAFYGREVIVADREMVESAADDILRGADSADVAFLVVGDPFGATTHTDLVVRARERGIAVRTVHNASIMNAAGCCGLQLYTFGQTVSIVLWNESWRPDSFYDKILANKKMGLHTLCLLDIKVKEQSWENLARVIDGSMAFACSRALRSATSLSTARACALAHPSRYLASYVNVAGSSGPGETTPPVQPSPTDSDNVLSKLPPRSSPIKAGMARYLGLPSAPRPAVRPMAPTSSLAPARDLADVEVFHQALRRNDLQLAWRSYKALFFHGAEEARVASEAAGTGRAGLPLAFLQADDHTAMLSVCAAQRRPRLASIHARRVFGNILDAGLQPDVRDFNLLMTCLLRAGDLRRVTAAFDAMRDVTVPVPFPEDLSQAAAQRMDALQDAGMLRRRERESVVPDLRSHLLLLAAHARLSPDPAAGAVAAWRVFARMARELPGAADDPDAHALLLEAGGRAADAAGVAEVLAWWGLLDAAAAAAPAGARRLVLADGPALRAAAAAAPRRRRRDREARRGVLDAAVLALARCGEHAGAARLLRDGYAGGTAGWGAGTLDAALAAAEVAGDLDAAERVWELLLRRWRGASSGQVGSRPLPTSVTCMMRMLLARGDTARVLVLFGEAEAEATAGTGPGASEEAHEIAVRALLQAGRTDEALDGYSRLLTQGYVPSATLVSAVERARQGLSFSSYAQ